jgi:hypothetical protein
MTTYSFYDPATGEISKRTFSGSARVLGLNTPTGMIPIEGAFDHRTQRIDPETKLPVDYAPGIAEVTAEKRDSRARAQIEALQTAAIVNLIDLALDPTDLQARQRLVTIRNRITVLRQELRS